MPIKDREEEIKKNPLSAQQERKEYRTFGLSYWNPTPYVVQSQPQVLGDEANRQQRLGRRAVAEALLKLKGGR